MCLRVCQIQPPTQQLGLLGHGIYNPQGGRLVSRVGHGYNPQPRLDATGSWGLQPTSWAVVSQVGVICIYNKIVGTTRSIFYFVSRT